MTLLLLIAAISPVGGSAVEQAVSASCSVLPPNPDKSAVLPPNPDKSAVLPPNPVKSLTLPPNPVKSAVLPPNPVKSAVLPSENPNVLAPAPTLRRSPLIPAFKPVKC